MRKPAQVVGWLSDLELLESEPASGARIRLRAGAMAKFLRDYMIIWPDRVFSRLIPLLCWSFTTRARAAPSIDQ